MIVKRTHFLWRDKQRSISDPRTPKSAQMVTKVEAVRKGRTQRKFKVAIRFSTQGKRKGYLCEVACKEDI